MPEENLQQNVEDILKTEEKTSAPGAYDSPLKPLRTYQGDIDEIIGKNKVSMVTIAVAEQKKKYAETPAARPVAPKTKPVTPEAKKETKPVASPAIKSAEKPPEKFEPDRWTEQTGGLEIKNKFSVVIGLILLIFGAVIVGTVYYAIRSSQKNPPVALPKSAPLNYNQEFDFDIGSSTGAAFVGAILAEEKSFNSAQNSVLYINPTENGAGAFAKDVFIELSPHIPPSLLRNLGDSYMLGLYSSGANHPFIVLTVDDYGAGYAGMLAWENTMIPDIGQIFNVPSPVGTSTPPYVWSDETVQNKDLRIVKDQNGRTVLLYSFLNESTILITDNEETFDAVLEKFFNDQMVR
jgi:hypothetical protein